MPGKKRQSVGEVSTYQANKFQANQKRKQANKMGAEGPKKSSPRPGGIGKGGGKGTPGNKRGR